MQYVTHAMIVSEGTTNGIRQLVEEEKCRPKTKGKQMSI